MATKQCAYSFKYWNVPVYLLAFFYFSVGVDSVGVET